MVLTKQISNKIRAALTGRQILYLLGVIFLTVLVGVVIGGGVVSGKGLVGLISLMGLIGFGPFIVKRFGLSPFLAAYAALSWYQSSISFDDGFLLNITIWEIAIYSAFLALPVVFLLNIGVAWKWFFATPGLLPLAGFVTCAIIASIIGPKIGNVVGFYYLRYTVFYAFAIYLFIANCISKPRDAIYILVGLVVGGVFFSSLLSFNINGAWNPLLRVMQTRYAGYSFNGRAWDWGSVPLATYISLTLSLAATLALNGKKVWLILLFSIASVLLSVMLILTEGRAAFIASGASLLTIFILSTSGYRGLVWKISLSGLFLSLLLVISLSTLLSSGLVNQTLFIRLQGYSQGVNDTNMVFRINIWQRAFNLLFANPLGVGFGYWGATQHYTAHNDLLEVALGSGFLGASFYLFFFFVVIKNFVNGLKGVDQTVRIVCIAALGCCVSYVINGIGDSPSANNRWAWQVLWIVLASAAGVLRNAAYRGRKS